MKADLQTTAMRASLVVAVLMLVGKLTAFFMTGSAAILSDAAESVVHILATSVAAVSLWYAQHPADEQHPYGHGKIAFFSAGFEGGLILTAALFIVYEGVHALILGPELRQLGWGLAITAGLGLVNLFLGLFLIRVGRRNNALILVANGQHVLTDMWTSAAVVVAVGIVWITIIADHPMMWLDPVIAIAAGLNIMYSAFALMRGAFRGLLDEADPTKTRLIQDRLEQASADGDISGFHQLRHRQSNDVMWVEVHMLLPGASTTTQAHTQVTQVEDSIRKLFPEYRVHVTSHIEPDLHAKDHPQGHPGLRDPLADVPRPSPADPAPPSTKDKLLHGSE